MSLWQKLLSVFRGNGSANDDCMWSPVVAMPTDSGIPVSEQTALTYSAVFGCVRIISETLACLAWHVYERVGDARERRANHPAERLLHRRPNPEMSAFDFRQTLQAHVLTWGNGYAEIERNYLGQPIALWPITPDRVTPRRDDRRQIVYEVSPGPDQPGPPRTIPADQMFHVHGLGFDGLCGYSPIRLAAQSIGLGLAAERFGATFFGNGARPGAVLEHPEGLTDQGRKHLKESIDEFRRAGANRTMILEHGTTWKTIAVEPEAAQFLESRKFQVQEICRWFRVPPHKLADLERATFSNIEHQSIEFVTDAIMPWVCQWEQEADAKLFLPEEADTYFAKIRLHSLLRGDSQQRANWYKAMREIGVYTVNDILAAEDENPIGPEGDVRYVPGNWMRLGESQVDQSTGVQDESGDSDGDQSQDAEDDAEQTDASAVLMPVFVQAIGRVVAKECNAIARADRKHADLDEFRKWVDDFYDNQIRGYLSQELDPPLASWRQLQPTEYDISGFVLVYAESAKLQLIEAKKVGTVPSLLAQWKDDHPANVAGDLIKRLMEARDNVAA